MGGGIRTGEGGKPFEARRRSGKGQSAIEYLTTYGWAILIVAVVLVMLYVFVVSPQTAVPQNCTFNSGVGCSDFVFASNAVSSKMVMLLSNAEPYPLQNPSIIVNVQNGGNVTGTCSPSYVLPGGAIICTVPISQSYSQGQLVSGSVYLSGTTCSAPAGCTGAPAQVYSGKIATHVQAATPNANTVTITLNAMAASEPATGAGDPLTAEVSLLGSPLQGASVFFTVSPTFPALSPASGTTNSDGKVISLISSTTPGNVVATATFAGYSNTVSVDFTPPMYVIYTAVNAPQSSNVAVVDGVTYTGSQLPVTLPVASGSRQSYSYNGALSASGCGTSGTQSTFIATYNCTVTGQYQPQITLYALTARNSSSSPVNIMIFNNFAALGIGAYNSVPSTLPGNLMVAPNPDNVLGQAGPISVPPGNVAAVFSINGYDINYISTLFSSGSAAAEWANANNGGPVEGFTFNGWSGTNVLDPSTNSFTASNSFTFAMPNASVTENVMYGCLPPEPLVEGYSGTGFIGSYNGVGFGKGAPTVLYAYTSWPGCGPVTFTWTVCFDELCGAPYTSNGYAIPMNAASTASSASSVLGYYSSIFEPTLTQPSPNYYGAYTFQLTANSPYGSGTTNVMFFPSGNVVADQLYALGVGFSNSIVSVPQGTPANIPYWTSGGPFNGVGPSSGVLYSTLGIPAANTISCTYEIYNPNSPTLNTLQDFNGLQFTNPNALNLPSCGNDNNHGVLSINTNSLTPGVYGLTIEYENVGGIALASTVFYVSSPPPAELPIYCLPVGETQANCPSGYDYEPLEAGDYYDCPNNNGVAATPGQVMCYLANSGTGGVQDTVANSTAGSGASLGAANAIDGYNNREGDCPTSTTGDCGGGTP